MGPIVLFDKSTIEMMNVDEAAIFDCLFMSNLCPIYYVEVLADLQKEITSGRTHAKVVADVARKTPIMHVYPNEYHASICLQELLGFSIELRNVPIVGGAQAVRNKGKIGVVYDETPASKAFNRWQKGNFLEVEHFFVRQWREQLAKINLTETALLVRDVLSVRSTPKNLDEALSIAREAIEGRGQRYRTLKFAYSLLGLDRDFWPSVVARWKASGGPPLQKYAPYTAHCLLVDVFFYLCIDKKLISPERPSNRTDIAYLYYLPFAMVFASNDKLHQRTARLFMNETQIFLNAGELKADLQALDRFYSSLPPEEMAEGLFKAASKALAHDFLATRLYKKFGHRTKESPVPASNGPNAAELLASVKELTSLAKRQGVPVRQAVRAKDADQLVMKRLIPLRRGKWQFLPPGIESYSDDED